MLGGKERELCIDPELAGFMLAIEDIWKASIWWGLPYFPEAHRSIPGIARLEGDNRYHWMMSES